METEGFFSLNLKLSSMSQSALPDSFEYLCYGSMAIINIFTLTVWGYTLVVSVYRRQILTTKVYPRTVRVKLLVTNIYLFILYILVTNLFY